MAPTPSFACFSETANLKHKWSGGRWDLYLESHGAESFTLPVGTGGPHLKFDPADLQPISHETGFGAVNLEKGSFGLRGW